MTITFTRSDLATKTPCQLKGLFQQVSREVSASQSDQNAAQSVLAMIAQELASRGPAP